ncbi:MAG: protein kinase, partial [Myxococcales bacterium]|nr:protein kinase [Myxococcales bacterium]
MVPPARFSMLLALALAATAGVGACLRPGVFACESDASCISRGVQGVCEPSGFCSYPSDACESGQRYDEFAGAGLASTCTEPREDTSTGTSTGTGTTTDTDTDTDACPPPVDCEDHDGDGYGAGLDCLGPDCDDDNPAHADACVYVSPAGDDAGAGTRDDPWRTFARALPELSPGQSLVLLDGVYEPSTTGLPDIECFDGGNARSGTAQAPISIRAEQERGPLLMGDGSSPAVSIDGCQHWRLFGLRGRNADSPGSQGGQQTYTVLIRDSQDIVARRLLFSHNNRYYNTHLYGITGSLRVLVEDSEAYDFHRAGFFLTDSQQVTLRRCYARGSDFPDLPDCSGEVDPETPYCSGTTTTGDHGFEAYRDVIEARFENCVADGPLGSGIHLDASCHDNHIEGSAIIGAVNGVLVSAGDALPAERNALVDVVARADLRAMLEATEPLPALARAERTSEVAEVIQEGGYFATLFVGIRHPFGLVRTLERLAAKDRLPLPIDTLPTGAHLVWRGMDEEIPRLALAVHWPEGHGDGPLAAPRAIEIALQVASGLRYAHRRGVVHRDLKPSNLLLKYTEEGGEIVKIVDFGLVKLTEADQSITRAGLILGSPHCMSPEQVQGREVDHRADIYSLGCVLYHLLTGRPPFQGENSAVVMEQHVRTAPADPKTLR